jgi:hypothetical protein
VLEASATSTRQYLFSAYTAHTAGLRGYWPTRTVRDEQYKLILNVMVSPGHGNSPPPMASNPNNEKNLCPMGGNPFMSKNRAEFELYDLSTDPDEVTSLIGEPQYALTEARLKDALQDWRQRVLDDPFLDAGFRADFHTQYLANLLWIQDKRQEFGKADKHVPETWFELDQSKWILQWNSTQYTNQDPLSPVHGTTPTGADTTVATSTGTTKSAHADCSPTILTRCRDILGPNGGEKACKWSNQMKKCVNNPQFVDIRDPQCSFCARQRRGRRPVRAS